ncbi:MAG TPA: hypothetical protein PLA98_04485 [Alicycliphilus sp.]|jgi:hypothetical protein|nr:hypothetical protein [Alicycliphilus sp.]
MSGILPNFPDWRQFDALAIWQLAALMRGVDPRAWAAGDVIGHDGDALDLSNQQDQLISGIHAGTLLQGKNELAPPTKDTIVVTASALEWLRTHSHEDLADNLDRSLHAPKPEDLVKKEDLIKRHQRVWPTIEEDLKRANQTGLDAARTESHGIWNQAQALKWAERHGKLTGFSTSFAKQQSALPT